MKKVVVLTFDDACSSCAQLAAPLLKKFNFGATFFVCEFPRSAADDPGIYMDYKTIARLHRQGFEIGNHSIAHDQLSGSDSRRDSANIRALNEKLAAAGIPRPVSYAYPGGTVPQDVSVLKKCSVKYARTTEQLPWQVENDLLHIPAFPVHGNSDEPFFRALASGSADKVPVLLYHGIPDHAHPWVNTPPENFIRQMKYLKKENYTVLSLADGAAYLAARRRRIDDKLRELFANIIPEKIGRNYMEAATRQEKVRALAEYFRNRATSRYVQEIVQMPADEDTARRGMKGEVTVINIPHTFADGNFDYLFNPTLKRDVVDNEWLWQLNRFYWWHDMARLYVRQPESEIAAAFNRQLRDWIDQIDIPARYNSAGSPWRTIEAGIRMMTSWPMAFEAFRAAPEVSDENLCLMLHSFYLHSRHLMKHKTRGNWMLMEMTGAYHCAVTFPEFKNSATVRKKSAAILVKALSDQILPDGLQNELSPDYHLVTLLCAAQLLKISMMQGTFDELPPEFATKIKNAVLAPIALATPAQNMPRTNDCYTIKLSRMTTPFADIFPGTPEFAWVESDRASGAPPAVAADGNASKIFPYAGFAAMRSSWDADANYLCFDFGQLGRGHWHWDKLNVNIYSGSDELICDDGGGPYELSPRRVFARSAANHNTVLVDGMGQYRENKRNLVKPNPVVWHSTAEKDYAKASYTEGFGENMALTATHTREVLFLKPGIFCIADTLSARDGAAHDYDLLWQLDTTAVKMVKQLPGALISDFKKSRDILIVPLNRRGLTTRCFSGETSPEYCGWFIGRNNLTIHPATTVKMRVAGRKRFRFVTLLIPVDPAAPLPEIKECGKNLFSVKTGDQQVIIDTADLAAQKEK